MFKETGSRQFDDIHVQHLWLESDREGIWISPLSFMVVSWTFPHRSCYLGQQLWIQNKLWCHWCQHHEWMQYRIYFYTEYNKLWVTDFILTLNGTIAWCTLRLWSNERIVPFFMHFVTGAADIHVPANAPWFFIGCIYLLCLNCTLQISFINWTGSCLFCYHIVTQRENFSCHICFFIL